MAHPQGGPFTTVSRSNWNLETLVFEESGKPEYPEKNLLEQGREPTTNSTHIWHRERESNPGHIGGRRALSPLRHPYSPTSKIWFSSELRNLISRYLLFYYNYYIFISQGEAISKTDRSGIKKMANFGLKSQECPPGPNPLSPREYTIYRG